MHRVQKSWMKPMLVRFRLCNYYVQVYLPFRRQSSPQALRYLALHVRYVVMPETRCNLAPRTTCVSLPTRSAAKRRSSAVFISKTLRTTRSRTPISGC